MWLFHRFQLFENRYEAMAAWCVHPIVQPDLVDPKDWPKTAAKKMEIKRNKQVYPEHAYCNKDHNSASGLGGRAF